MKKLLLLLSVILFLSSCHDDKKSSTKKFFRYNQASGITSLDPAFAKDLANMNADGMIFNGLVQLDSNQKIVPCIARSWDISTDGLEYTFHLRDDVFFHSSEVFADSKGRKVTAQDFAYSFSR